tara:strand:- start:604 stop:783 length:180 start_codon:yes stop_codon:yes gene_type:complete
MSKIQALESRIKEIKEHLAELSLVKYQTTTLTDSIVYWERELEQKSVELQHRLRVRYDS